MYISHCHTYPHTFAVVSDMICGTTTHSETFIPICIRKCMQIISEKVANKCGFGGESKYELPNRSKDMQLDMHYCMIFNIHTINAHLSEII